MPTLSMLLVSLISYIDRNTLALLAPTILKESGLTGEQYGFVISAFSIAYMAGNPIWGILLDRYGVRVGMTVAVGFWSLASAAHAFATGLASFAAARALLGFGEGATFPGGLRTAAQTLPPEQRARGIAVAYSGGSLGAILTPLIVTPIALHFGWRGAFWFTGLVGAAWLALWSVVGRQVPHQAPAVRQAASTPTLGDSRLWAYMAAYAFGALPIAFVIYGAAIYLSQVRGLSQGSIGALMWIPPVGWETGYFFWGWISDRSGRDLAAFRRLLAIVALLSLLLALAPQAPNVATVMAALFISMFMGAGFIILPVAYATEVFSKESSGLIAGAGAGAWSAAVAVIMPVFGRLFDAHRFSAGFALASVLPLAGYALWYALSARSIPKPA